MEFIQIPPLQPLLTASGLSFLLVFLAEFGDKSQLVCMTLAARHRPWPVLAGAVIAFALLNLLAVMFGATVAHWLPPFWIAIAVALLFTLFGIQALMSHEDDEEELVQRSVRSLFATAFVLIFVAEFGDKTQLAVAGLSAAQPPVAVWLGSTLALLATSALGVVLGRTLLQRLPLSWLHRGSGVLFLLMAATAFYQSTTVA
ncbi:MAG: TMEM165/GDT1 family protein [Motiliproteus sp.]